MSDILSIENLVVAFKDKDRLLHAVDGINLAVSSGEMVAVVGESGCGKTLTASVCMGLAPYSAKISADKLGIDGKNMFGATEEEWNSIRGENISMIFQEPMTALNPLIKVGKQVAENAISIGKSKEEAKKLTLETLELVGLGDSERIYNSYPHQLSGGMRQRVMIAMAVINRPALLIADEPTTALDVTIQAQIMELIKEMNKKIGTAVLLITHDLGLVKSGCDRVYVMYAGRIAESGPVEEVISNPLHPYTKGLINSIPSYKKRGEELEAISGIVPPLGNRKELSCLFYDRCHARTPFCNDNIPKRTIKGEREVYCHLYSGGA